MHFGNLFSLWVNIGLVAALVFVTAWTYARSAMQPLSKEKRLVLATLRFITLILLLAILQRPIVVEHRVANPDIVVPVLVDVSRSMRLQDAGGQSRISRAIEVAHNVLLPSIREQYDIEVLGFGDKLQVDDLLQLKANARRSDLAGALDEVRERYRGRSVGGVIVISDGGDTSDREPAAVIQEGDPPIFSIGVGGPDSFSDREVLSVTVGEAPLPESTVELAASVVSHGFGIDPIEIRLHEDGRVIQVSRVIPTTPGSAVRKIFRVSPKPDVATLYTVEVVNDPVELTTNNNTQQVLVKPAERTRRILMVEGAPGHEHSFLKRAWGVDPGFKLDSVLRKGQNDRGQDTFYIQGHDEWTRALSTGFPEERHELFRYDAVAFGNVDFQSYSSEQLSMIEEFVSRRGGGVMVFGARSFAGRGLANTPLATILPLNVSGKLPNLSLPINQEPHRVNLTFDGERHRIMHLGNSIQSTRDRWLNAPPIAAVSVLGNPKPGASLLAFTLGSTGGVYPLIAVQRYGRGRTMIFTGEASWRWKMLLPSDDTTYETFWRQTARWLSTASPGPVTVATRGGVSLGDEVTVDLFNRDVRFEPVLNRSIVAQVTNPNGEIVQVPLTLIDGETGQYEGKFTPIDRGVYRIDVDSGKRTADFRTVRDWILIGGSDLEFAGPRLHREVLSRMATVSGGAMMELDTVGDVSTMLQNRLLDQRPLVPRDLWDSLWIFLLLVALLSVEWALRRHWGLR